MVETTLWYVENKGLFSNHYLENQLLMLDEWKEPNNIEEVFSKIKALYQNKQSLFPNANESQLREEFLNPVLKYLGHYYQVEGKTEGASKFPDYGLFSDEKSADDAVKYQGTEDFYKKAIAICEAKAWEIKLDERDPKNIEPNKRTPNRQIDDYLRWSEKKWGILTNGRFWRLYYRENSYRNYFYQVDLAEIIEKDDIEAFRYFYLFFRKDVFDVDVNNVCFLDRVYQGSVDYAKDIGKNLEENVYKAMKILAEGFINRGESKLTKTEEDLKIIQENTMEFLYRLLFIFFAEAEGLLDISKKTPASKNYAEHYSLDSLKKKIKNRIKSGEDIPVYIDSYYNQLQTLFNFIDKGTEVSNIPKEKLYIPSYNGGLFDTEKNKFLSENKIGDYYLAKAIDLLASTEGKKPEEKGFIDYSSLDIRHLGSIYEGLLEYKLRLATEPMVAVKEKGKEKWIPESEFKGKKSIVRVDANEIYLATDKGERKATGSYYTPEYIVKYIVENTLTPIVNEKMDNAIKNNERCSDAILSINVLDPAMGSGHFLVEAVDFLGHHLGDAINKDIERGLINEGEYPDDWLRREIVSHCIYGVDLNPMAVELAKVSLWLKTISKDKPLSFLDHRLKCGNSLIGCNLTDLPWYPELKKKKTIRKERRLDIPEGFIKKIVRTIKQLSEISDETLDDIKKKETIFNEFKNTMEYDMIKTLGDVRTSIYFGNKIDRKTYGDYTGQAFWSTKDEWKWRRNRWFARDARRAAENKSFFHWELEFPEIFFEEGKIKENPGFDAVVGNPPYGAEIKDYEKDFIDLQFDATTSDSAAYFLELSQRLSNKYYGMIVPKSIAFYTGWKSIRKIVLERNSVTHLLDVGIAFEDVNYEEIVLIVSKRQMETSKAIIHQAIPLKRPNIHKEIISDGGVSLELMKIADALIFRGIANNEEGIIWKLKRVSCPLENLRKEVYRGIYISDSDKATLPPGKYMFVNKVPDVQRYFIERIWEIDINQNRKWVEKAKKIMVSRIFLKVLRGSRLVGFYDPGELLTTEKLVNITLRPESGYEPPFIVALINSPLISFYIQRILFSKTTETSRVMDDPYTKVFPIRRISFTTPKEEREKFIADLKQKYQDEKFDEILKTVEEYLPKDKEGNFITEKEKSDVVHDFLAFLAEQMIEMNKQKQTEVKGFMEWLEREIGTEINDLSNKTVIKEYYKNNFDKLIEVLKKNKKKIPINLSNREFQMNFEKEFNKSRAKLNPLMKKIESTDNLIDQIVYKLYGLMDEEIKVVEESLSKK